MLFYRKYYYLQPTAQIAAELGMTERAVEGRLYRLKKDDLTSQHRTESSILFRMVLFIFTLRRSNK